LRAKLPLTRLLEVLGPGLLSARFMPPTSPQDVLDVVIWDASDEPAVSPGHLVLGVGVRDESSVMSLLHRLGSQAVAGLVVKLQCSSSRPAPPVVCAAAAESGVPLIQLASGASWEQVVVLIRSLLVPGSRLLEGNGTLSGAVNDLFGLAEALSAVLDAPVTIEDPASRVLAFSARQNGVDEARRETILGRRVPERYTEMLEQRGIFRRLVNDTGPIYVDGLTEDMLPRIAVSIRASQEVLGSIWAATTEPLSTERQEWLADAAKLVALQLLRIRAEADLGQRLRGEQLAALLQGGELSSHAAARLGLAPGAACVVAAAPRHADPASAEAELQRLMTSLSVHLSAVRPRSAVARIGDVVYAVISPVEEGDCAAAGPAQLMRQFVDYADHGQSFLIGVGRSASAFTELVRSRADADKAVRVLREQPQDRQVVQFAHVQVESLLVRMTDLLVEDEDVCPGPIANLLSYDRRHGADLLDTLVAYLEAFGDVGAASEIVHVHPNTFRYRLRRLSSISGLNLGDPDVRFSTMLQLRLRALADTRQSVPPPVLETPVR
jgi:DNA-binding PucR family transcriptional regulator